jgi:uracil-DNA glycosylase
MQTHVLVGEDYGHAPEQYARERYALTGRSGERLAWLAGVAPLRFYARTVRLDVVRRPEDWRDARVVMEGLDLVLSRIDEARLPVIAVGQRAAGALGVAHLPLLTWCSWRPEDPSSIPVAVMPHPSGRNRWWNYDANVEAARAFMREVARSW